MRAGQRQRQRRKAVAAGSEACEDFYFPPRDAGFLRRNWRAILRVLFASIWSVDAFLKWQFVLSGDTLSEVIDSQAQGQPPVIRAWISAWADFSSSIPHFTLFVAILETTIALFLFIGLLTPLVSFAGIIFSLLIWSTAEGFGGMFQAGATDVGASPLYAAIFAGLIVIEAGRQTGVDKILHERHPAVPLW